VVTRICVSVCLSAAACPHYCTDPDATWGSGRGCTLVVHYWVDLQSVHGLRCYDNITRTRSVSVYMLVLALCIVTGSIAHSASGRYLVYSETDVEVFRPAGATRCTDGGKIWPGGGNRRSPPPCQISPTSVQRQWCRTPKTEIFTQISPKCGI